MQIYGNLYKWDIIDRRNIVHIKRKFVIDIYRNFTIIIPLTIEPSTIELAKIAIISRC